MSQFLKRSKSVPVPRIASTDEKRALRLNELSRVVRIDEEHTV